MAIEQLLVVVQPHLSHARQVPLHRSHPILRERVGVVVPEDVPDSGARDDLNFSSAHPDLRSRDVWAGTLRSGFVQGRRAVAGLVAVPVGVRTSGAQDRLPGATYLE